MLHPFSSRRLKVPLMRSKIATEFKESHADMIFSCETIRHTPRTHRLFLESIIQHKHMDMQQRKQ